MSQIRAKFKCMSLTQLATTKSVKNEDGSYSSVPGLLYSIKMNPVYSNDPDSENRKFWDATPSGQLELNMIHNGSFEIGAEYYLDFTKAE